MLVLFCDSDMDMTPEICAQYGYQMISMPYIVDGREILPYKDFDRFDAHEFYEMLRNGTMPTTGGISVAEYVDYFEPHFAAGNDILYVHFSAAMSNTFDSMRLALDELKVKYPERKFYEIDVKGISILGMAIAMEVGDMIKAGKSVEEVLKWAETGIYNYAVYFMADNLNFFRRSGRVSGLAAVMGGLVGIKPIIYMNSEGMMVSCGKERGRMAALDRIVKYMDELGDDVENHRVFIASADCMHLVDEIKSRLHDRYGDRLDIHVVDVNPTAGAHCGPDATGICFHSIHR